MSKKNNSKLVLVDARSLSTLPAAPAKGSRKTRRPRRQGNQQLSQTPAAYNAVLRTSAPSLRPLPGGDGRIVVTHREYLMPIGVDATIAFQCRKKEINPGLSTTFPWLSGIARLYESYRFRSLVVEYVPAVGTTTSGSLSLALDFDAYDDPPQSKADLMSNHRAVRGNAWSPLSLSADRQDLNKFGVQRYTRQAELAPNLDIKTYDVCALFVATDNGTTPWTGFGDIFISYTVELMTPQSPVWDMGNPQTMSLDVVGVGNVSKVTPFGNIPNVQQTANFGAQVTNGSYLEIIRTGKYLLNEIFDGTGLVPPIWTTITGAANVASSSTVTNGASTTGNSTRYLDVTAVPFVSQIQAPGATSLSQYELRMSPWLV